MDHPPLIQVAVAARVAAALVLILGPWTDSAVDLAGWDIERFMAIAADAGRAWRDTPVEYPPGSVVVFDLLDRWAWFGSETVVSAHRLLVVLGLVADLTVAAVLGRRHRSSAAAYLLLGLPLVPMGLVRLDLVVTLPAVAAAIVAIGPRTELHDNAHRSTRAPDEPGRVVVAGVLVAIGVMIKLWPVLLIPALWSVRRGRSAAAAVGACGLATLAWLAWADAGLDPIRQVVELRGATGWHVESVGGVVTVLADTIGLRALDPSEGVRLELNAYRVGTLSPALVTLGRALAVAALSALVLRARRADGRSPLQALAAVMLGATAALIVTAPLLSPQFLLWLTPWAALLVAGEVRVTRRPPTPVVLTAAATVITGVVLAVFGPPDLADPSAAVMLAVRNGVLAALPISCWRWLDPNAPTSEG